MASVAGAAPSAVPSSSSAAAASAASAMAAACASVAVCAAATSTAIASKRSSIQFFTKLDAQNALRGRGSTGLGSPAQPTRPAVLQWKEGERGCAGSGGAMRACGG